MRLQAASIVLTLASTFLVACGSTVTGGGSSGPACFEDCDDTTTTGSAPGSGGGGGAGGGDVVPPTQQAVAMTRAQMDVLWEEYWAANPSGSSGSTTTGGGGLDPNDLFLEVSSLGASCGSPFVELPCGGHWSVSIGIPAALQQVGVYELDSSALSLYSVMTETGQPYSPSPGDCSWGGGSMGPGTLEIVSIHETEVQFVLVLDQPWEADPSGTYTASRCP